jgi:hypothetical protein
MSPRRRPRGPSDEEEGIGNPSGPPLRNIPVVSMSSRSGLWEKKEKNWFLGHFSAKLSKKKMSTSSILSAHHFM